MPTPGTHAAPPHSSSDDGLPLATRAIAGLFILSGTCTLFDLLLDSLLGHGVTLNFGITLLPIGWGLLRHREWARGCALFVCGAIVVLGFLLAVFSWLVPIHQVHITPDPGPIGDVGRRLLLCAVGVVTGSLAMAALKHLRTERVKAQFTSDPDSLPFILWNPRRWQFTIGTLLYLTLLVAFLAVQLADEPVIQQFAYRHATGTPKMPEYLNGLPPLPTGEGHTARSIKLSDGRSGMLQYGYHTPPIAMGIPVLVYAVFDADEDLPGQKISFRHIEGQHRFAEIDFNGASLQLPQDAQLIEVSKNHLRKSNMQITFPEFWSFLHSNAPRTLDALEQHVQELRVRETIRDNR